MKLLLSVLVVIILNGCSSDSEMKKFGFNNDIQQDYFHNLKIGNIIDSKYFVNIGSETSNKISTRFEDSKFICYEIFSAASPDGKYTYIFINKNNNTIYKIIKNYEMLPYISQN